MVSSPKKRVLEKKVGVVSRGQIVDYIISAGLVFVVVMASYWCNNISEEKGVPPATPPPLTSSSVAFVLSMITAVLSGVIILQLTFRVSLPSYGESYRNILVLYVLVLLPRRQCYYEKLIIC